MKAVVLTDTHAGERNDHAALLDHQKLFYDEVFFPYLNKRDDIGAIFHLGDIFHRRKYINFSTLKRLRQDFLDPLHDIAEKYEVHIIPGNHDVYYKDTNETSAFQELIENKFPDFKLHMHPTTVKWLDGTSVMFMPWITKANYEECMSALASAEAPTLCGHLELYGFEMQHGKFCEHQDALKKDTFDKFQCVLTGHFHRKSDYQNIHYLGCPFQMRWDDYGETKGFHVFDTNTLELTFIPNPFSLFHKLEYSDAGKTMDQVLDVDFSKYRGSFVRVHVRSKENAFWFDHFREQINGVEPLSVQVIEDMGHLAFDGDETELLQVEDTIALLSKYCEQIGVADEMKPKLDQELQSLYNEANNARL